MEKVKWMSQGIPNISTLARECLLLPDWPIREERGIRLVTTKTCSEFSDIFVAQDSNVHSTWGDPDFKEQVFDRD